MHLLRDTCHDHADHCTTELLPAVVHDPAATARTVIIVDKTAWGPVALRYSAKDHAADQRRCQHRQRVPVEDHARIQCLLEAILQLIEVFTQPFPFFCRRPFEPFRLRTHRTVTTPLRRPRTGGTGSSTRTSLCMPMRSRIVASTNATPAVINAASHGSTRSSRPL